MQFNDTVTKTISVPSTFIQAWDWYLILIVKISGDYLIPRSYTATKQNRAFSAAGMAFLSNCALFHVIFRARFIVSLRPSFLLRSGLGALLSRTTTTRDL